MSQTANQSPREQHWLIRGVLWVRNVLLRNWPLKLLSLVLALALWAGLIAQDPTLTRDKVFRDVQVSVNNADILKRGGYIVTSDVASMLHGVDMMAEVPQMRYAEAQTRNYNVRGDLNSLERREGLQELPIRHTNTSTYGEVKWITPETITVMVEKYDYLDYIPVHVVRVGELPEGFYALGETRDPQWVTVSGPSSLVSRVERAEVVLDMSKLPAQEGLVERSLPITLVDAQGNPVESSMLSITRENAERKRITVGVTLCTRRDIEVLAADLYAGQPAEGYEVRDVYVTPSYITVAGQRSVVDSVNLLQTAKLVNIAGAKDTVTAVVDLSKPLNLQWMSSSKVSVTVVIAPRQASAEISGVPVEVTGLATGMSATLARETVLVRVSGEESLVKALTAEELQLTCDLTGLGEGVHEAALSCVLREPDGREYVLETEPMTVEVRIAPLPPAAEE